MIAATVTLGTRLYADGGTLDGGFGFTPPTVYPSASGLPVVNILATDPVALEGTSSGAFTLLRSGASTVALDVDLDYFRHRVRRGRLYDNQQHRDDSGWIARVGHSRRTAPGYGQSGEQECSIGHRD